MKKRRFILLVCILLFISLISYISVASIDLFSPDNESMLSNSLVTFNYNITSGQNIENCTINIAGDLKEIDTDGLGGSQTFSLGIEDNILVTADTSGSVGLGVFNISDKSNPVRTYIEDFSAGGVDIENQIAYITDYSNALLKIYNVSNPNNVRNIANISVGSFPVPVEVHEGYAYPQEYSGSNMYIVNVTDPFNPSLLSTIGLSATTPYGNGVKIIKNTLFVATKNGKVTIYNITNKSNPNQIKQYSYTGSPELTGIDVDENYMYIADYTNNRLSILNNPCSLFSSPSCLDTWTEIGNNNKTEGFTKPRHLDIQGDFVYFARHANPGGIQIYDVSDRTNPRLIDSQYVWTSPNTVEATGNYIYASMNQGALKTLEFNITSDTEQSISDGIQNFTKILKDDSYKWFISCTDNTTNKNSSVIYTFIIDTTNPLIKYNPNTNPSGYQDQDWILINITASDTNKDSVKLYWQGSLEDFQNQDGDIYWSNKTGLIDGNYSFYSWINDSVGQTNETSTRTIVIDTTNPLIEYNHNTNPSGYQNQDWILINITASDTNKDSVKLYWQGSLEDFQNQDRDIYWSNKTGLIDGNYSFYSWINDTAGQTNITSTRTTEIDTTNPLIEYNPNTNPSGYQDQDWVLINITASDTNKDSVKLYWQGSQEDFQNQDEDIYWSNKTGLIDGNYSFYSWINDTAGQTNETSTRTTVIDTLLPVVTFISPPNQSFSNGNQTFKFNVTDEGGIANCSLILDDSINLTDNSINVEINQTFKKVLSAGSHNWSINCTDNVGKKDSTKTRTITVIKSTNFSGKSTDFSQYNSTSIQNISNLILEEPNYGKINFTSSVNLSGGKDIDAHINIFDKSISINSTALPELNKSAIIYFYGVTYTGPGILRDGETCPSAICQEISYSSNTYIVNVTEFSKYTITETYSAPTTEEETTTSYSRGGVPIYYPTESNLQEGYSKILGKNGKLRFNIINETHELKVDNIQNNSATITISSNPITFNLSINETKKIDFDNNGFYDLSVLLKNITGHTYYRKAEVHTKSINEEIQDQSNKIEQDNNKTKDTNLTEKDNNLNEKDNLQKGNNKTKDTIQENIKYDKSIYVIIGVISIAIIITLLILKFKPRKKGKGKK